MEQKLIAKGGTADIYDLGNGTIFKCFHDDKNDYCIESEIQCTSSKVAIALGAPQILERVNDERGRGFIMENIRGQTMLEKMFVQGADLFMLNNKNAQFDPYYFLYYEEVDLQYNLYLQNLDRIIIEGPQILHLEGGSEKRQKKEVYYLSNISQINLLISSTYFFKKYKTSKVSIFLIKFLITLLWHNPYISSETKKYIKQIKSI